MNNEIEIVQVCIVVNELKKCVKNYWELLGIGPWRLLHLNNKNMKEYKVNGEAIKEKFDMYIAVCSVGNVELELIQPIEGANCFWQFLQEKGEGLHHVKIKIPAEMKDDFLVHLESDGNSIMQSGYVGEDFHAITDTRDKLAMMLEIGILGRVDMEFEIYPL